jgi:ParB family transcriptional regulator, chromosome partitioning protein
VVARRSGLGKGLDALIPNTGGKAPERAPGVPDDGTGLRDLTITDIRPNPNQPRVHFDEESLVELSASIQAIGVLQPILVRPVADGYELIAGERRWRAAQRAGLSVIPAVVRVTDDVASVEQALVENLHRQDLTPLEEAAAYQQLLEDFGMTHEQVATKVGKSRSAITNSLRLLTLPASIQQLLADGRLSAGHAKAILGTPNRTLQEDLAKRAVADQLSVRALEEAIRQDQPKPTTTTTGTKPRSVSSTLRPPGLLELEQLLGDHLNTSVSVSMTAKHGRVVIDFADLEDLERIYRLMTEGSTDEEA